MSLTALPVVVGDLTTLQTGIQFFTNASEATTQTGAINTPGSNDSVFTYAGSLLNSNISLSQVAMAVGAIAESGTIAVGDTTTPNTLTYFSTVFLPPQVAYAASIITPATPSGLNQTVFAAQALGLAVAGTTGFDTDWGTLTNSQFVTAAANATGVSTSAITSWLLYWLGQYGPGGPQASDIAGTTVTAQEAAYGATLGEAIGVALLNPTSANLETVFSTTGSNGFTPNTVTGLVANALIDNAEGTYVTGVALGALPAHTPLQGEFTPGGPVITLTTGVDTVVLNQSNSTVNGALGGAGAGSTWTPGDTITAAAGTTHQTFNIDGIGNTAVIDPTTLAGNSVSGVETVNIISNTNVFGLPDQAFHSDFTATGTMTATWAGLTTLNVTSGGNATGADVLTVDPTTAVNITDTLLTDTSSAMTVNGGSVITITENNLFNLNGGITVNGGTGTTSVSITQTESGPGNDGIVTITDANGASTDAAGTITTVLLDGLS